MSVVFMSYDINFCCIYAIDIVTPNTYIQQKYIPLTHIYNRNRYP